MYIHNQEWVITASEAVALLQKTGRKRGPLDVLPNVPDTVAEPADLVLDETTSGLAIGENTTQLLEACIAVLASPKRVVRLHYNVADSTVSRSIFATSDELPGIWVSLAGSAEPFRLSMRSDPELRFLIGDVLSAGAGIRLTKIGCDFSTQAALTFMAILDQTRRSWLVSLLRHLEPVSLFSLDDVKERLAEGGVEDFRWTLPLVEKLLPIPIGEMAVSEDPRPALLELIKAGLIEPVNEEATIFDWTEPGRVLTEGNRQAGSRMVLSQSYLLPEAELGHDVMLLTRTPLDLFLILMSGAEASLSTLMPEDLDTLMEQVFAAPLMTETVQGPEPAISGSEKGPTIVAVPPLTPPQPMVPVQSTVPASQTARKFCTSCGTQLSEGAKFCRQCGAKIP